MKNDLWTLVLAAGKGTRLRSVTGDVPKQFWRGLGSLSLLEQTVTRMMPVVPAERTVVVVDASHRPYVTGSAVRIPWGATEFQPIDRGTAVGVMLGLAAVAERDPDAIVALTPADHGVMDESTYRDGIAEAAQYARVHQRCVLFGTEPSTPASDYGWITAAPHVGAVPFRSVQGFVEKPPMHVARELFDSGAVWNTMVLVAPLIIAWDLCAQRLPGAAAIFQRASRKSANDRGRFLGHAYDSLPAGDFSRDVLTASASLSAYVWPEAMGWSDLGTPERLLDWQASLAGMRSQTASLVA